MISRREALIGISAIPWINGATAAGAQDTPDLFAVDAPPPEEGYADFNGTWSLPADIVPVARAPDLPDGYALAYGRILLHNSNELNAVFARNSGQRTFIEWFNANAAGRLSWAARGQIPTDQRTRSHFDAFWNAVTTGGPVTLLYVLAYMSIFTNERGGDLVSQGELFGLRPDYPGITYLYDRFQTNLPDGRALSKRSYNTDGSNRTVADLLNDPEYIRSHGNLPMLSSLPSAQSAVWSGYKFPRPYPAACGDPAQNGRLLETDFYKFRGRGVIQTTWRGNYKRLVLFVQEYSGDDPLVRLYRSQWQGRDPDLICTTSSNRDWDALFNDGRLTILGAAVQSHAEGGGYMPLSADTAALNGGFATRGSLRMMGARIGGSSGYAELFKARVQQLCLTLGMTPRMT